MRIDAFGRELEIQRVGDRWRVRDVGVEGKTRPAHDIRIPGSVPEEALLTYLDDLLHETATARHPRVSWLTRGV